MFNSSISSSSSQPPREEFKKPSKFKISRVVVSSPNSLRASAQAVGNLAACLVTTGHTSKMFKAKAVHSGFDVARVWAQHYFGEDLVGLSKNISQKEILRNKLDEIAAKELLAEVSAFIESGKVQYAFVETEKELDAAITDGICAGIRMDIATKYLQHGETLQNIFSMNKEGASKEASAYQAVYDNLDAREPPAKHLNNTLQDLKTLSTHGLEILHCNFDEVGTALIEADPALWNPGGPFQDFTEKYPFAAQRSDSLPAIIRTVVDQELQEKRESEWIIQNADKQWEIKDVGKFKEAILNQISPDQKELTLALDWTMALLQLRKGEPISHPLISNIISLVNHDRLDIHREQAIATTQGLELLSVADIMGHYSIHSGDNSYLSNLPKLPSGMYSVDFYTGNGGHSISYIKVSNDESYILDPNGFIIRCRDEEHTLLQFRKLLALYKEPNNPTIIHEKGEPDHQIRMRKFESTS